MDQAVIDADLVLVRGLPGSGKSTLAKKLPNRVHLESDMYFERDGEYKFDASRLRNAHEWCQRETRRLLAEGKRVVVSNTFTQLWELQAYLDMAKELGCSVKVIEATGNYGNVHGVPPESLEKMRNRWEKYSPEELP